MAFANTGGLLFVRRSKLALVPNTHPTDHQDDLCGRRSDLLCRGLRRVWVLESQHRKWTVVIPQPIIPRLEDKAHQNEEIWNIIKQEDDILLPVFSVSYTAIEMIACTR